MNKYLFLIMLFTPYLLLVISRNRELVDQETAMYIMGFLVIIYSPVIYLFRIRHLNKHKDKSYLTPFLRLRHFKKIFTEN